jgi:hypothetical protein
VNFRTTAAALGAAVFSLMCQLTSPSKTNDNNQPPAFFPTSEQKVNANNGITFAVSASDPEGGRVSYACENQPARAAFNDTTGVFSWIPLVADSGRRAIVFSATDGRAAAFDTVVITVVVLKGPLPEFASHQKHLIAQVNQELAVQIRATNPASDSVDIGVSSSPPGSRWTDTATPGNLVYRYTPAARDTGDTFTVIFSAANANGTVYDTISFEVRKPGQAAGVVGSWGVSDQGTTVSITFQADAGYSLMISIMDGVIPTIMATETGTYTVSGNSVTMTGTNCMVLAMAAACGDPQTGTISGNQMTIPTDDGETMVLTKE